MLLKLNLFLLLELLKLNLFLLMEQHRSWDSVLISIYWRDAHTIKNRKVWERAMKKCYAFVYESSFKKDFENVVNSLGVDKWDASFFFYKSAGSSLKILKINPLNPWQYTHICTLTLSFPYYVPVSVSVLSALQSNNYIHWHFTNLPYILLPISATYSFLCLKIWFFDPNHDYITPLHCP